MSKWECASVRIPIFFAYTFVCMFFFVYLQMNNHDDNIYCKYCIMFAVRNDIDYVRVYQFFGR